MCFRRFATLTKEKQVNDVTPLVLESQPTANLCVIEDVDQAMPILSKALGSDATGVSTTQRMSADWPFAD